MFIRGRRVSAFMALDLSFLRKLGLSDGPIAVYRAMLEEGDASVERLREATGFERRNVYDMLARLEERGLATYFREGKVKRYRLADPRHIISGIDEEISELEAVKKEAAAAAGEIEVAMRRRGIERYAEIYRGRNAVKAVFEDLLSVEHNYFIGGNRGVMRFLPPSFWPLFNQRRIRKRVWWHDLVQEGFVFPEYEAMTPEQRRKEFFEYKALPPELKSPNVIFIYGSRVANVVWAETPIAFVINDEVIAQNYVEYFKLLWENAREP